MTAYDRALQQLQVDGELVEGCERCGRTDVEIALSVKLDAWTCLSCHLQGVEQEAATAADQERPTQLRSS